MAVEEPAFRSVIHDGAFEIRDYPALTVAEVTVEGDQKEAANKGFRLLAAYIFGGNARRQSVAMTAPGAFETRFARRRQRRAASMTIIIPSIRIVQQRDEEKKRERIVV
jgi:orotidine-5'-phosphate decarboxylase